MNEKDPYELLGISQGATPAEARRAFLLKVKENHPDIFDQNLQPQEWRRANEVLKQLNEAYESIKRGTIHVAVYQEPSVHDVKTPPPVVRPIRKKSYFVPICLVTAMAAFLVGYNLFASQGMGRAGAHDASQVGMVLGCPETGILSTFYEEPPRFPLAVKASPGTHYYVKMQDIDTGKNVVVMFVRAGQQVRALLPAGKYRLKYALGAEWLDKERLFGPSTLFYQAEQPMLFFENPTGNSVQVVDLAEVTRGGMSGIQIPSHQW